MKKVVILTNIIPPYRLPLFNGVAEKVKLDVLICTTREKNRTWDLPKGTKFNIKKLYGISLSLKNSLNDYRFIYLKFSILFYLLFNRPDKLVIGDASLTSYFAAFCCKLLNIKYIWWNEILPFTPISKGIVDKLRKFAIKNADHHFVSGTLAKEFILSYGVSEKDISIIPDAVDNDKYFGYFQKYKPFKEEIRKKYNIQKNDYVLLYVGQFIERKNIDIMLEAYKEIYKQDKNVKFIMVGSGELTEKIITYKRKHDLQGLIVENFMPSDELAKLYVISDLLILVSKSEPWGMVVNEAMCFGIPVLLSSNIGAGADLVDENTGKIVHNIDAFKLRECIQFMKKKNFSSSLIVKKIKEWNNDIAIAKFVERL